MKPLFLFRAFWCLAPLAAAFLIPLALDIWVKSHRFTRPIAEAFPSVIADYSRPLGDSLWVTTFYQLPPFVLLAGVLAFFACRLSTRRLVALSLLGLTIICFVQVRMTIPILKDIPEGEAEFVQLRYISVSVVCTILLSLLYFFRPLSNSNEPDSA